MTLTDTNGLLVFQQAAELAARHDVRVGRARVDSALEAALRDAGIWASYQPLVFDRTADAVTSYEETDPPGPHGPAARRA